MYTYAFERLDVWQLARQFVVYMYRLTGKFPAEERFGLVAQLRRAAISICSNIAEGSARSSRKDQAHFYQVAYGSALEVLNQVIISCDLDLIEMNDFDDCRDRIERLSNKINALRKTIYPSISKTTKQPGT